MAIPREVFSEFKVGVIALVLAPVVPAIVTAVDSTAVA